MFFSYWSFDAASPVQITNGWVLVFELSSCGFESRCSHFAETSDIAPVSSEEFLDIQTTIKCGFTLKCVHDMIRTYSEFTGFAYCRHSTSNEIRSRLNNGYLYFNIMCKDWRKFSYISTDATLHSYKLCSYKTVFWKYAANLQKNTQAEVWFQ